MGGVIVATVAAGGKHRSALGCRFFVFQPLVLVYYSTLDPFPRETVPPSSLACELRRRTAVFKSTQDDNVDALWVHWPVRSLQFLHHFIHATQELPRVFSQLHLHHHVEINGETSALLESVVLVVLHKLGPFFAG